MDRKTFFVMAGAMAVALAGQFPVQASAAQKTAIFAGGCFWCVEKDFEHVDGVSEVVSGYTGGTLENPTYRNHEGHVEAVRIMFDDSKVSYQDLLKTYWRSVDPTDAGGQFCDRGHSYTTAIFALDDEQMKQAELSRAEVEASGKLPGPVVTPILAASFFTDAEDYHQDYHRTNPVRYRFYKFSCGRAERLQQLWGPKPAGS